MVHWPEHLLKSFEAIPPGSVKPLFYGPYNSILLSLFPASRNFVVAPQWPYNDADTIDFAVLHKGKVVLFMENEKRECLDSDHDRGEADLLIREKFNYFRTHMHTVSGEIRNLYGICAIGTQFMVYTFDTNTQSITPVQVLGSGVQVNTAPRQWWEWNILEPAGAKELKKIGKECYTYFQPSSVDDRDVHPIGISKRSFLCCAL